MVQRLKVILSENIVLAPSVLRAGACSSLKYVEGENLIIAYLTRGSIVDIDVLQKYVLRILYGHSPAQRN